MQKYSVNLTEDAVNDIAELMAFYEELVDAQSAIKFFDEDYGDLGKLRKLTTS